MTVLLANQYFEKIKTKNENCFLKKKIKHRLMQNLKRKKEKTILFCFYWLFDFIF